MLHPKHGSPPQSSDRAITTSRTFLSNKSISPASKSPPSSTRSLPVQKRHSMLEKTREITSLSSPRHKGDELDEDTSDFSGWVTLHKKVFAPPDSQGILRGKHVSLDTSPSKTNCKTPRRPQTIPHASSSYTAQDRVGAPIRNYNERRSPKKLSPYHQQRDTDWDNRFSIAQMPEYNALQDKHCPYTKSEHFFSVVIRSAKRSKKTLFRPISAPKNIRCRRNKKKTISTESPTKINNLPCQGLHGDGCEVSQLKDKLFKSEQLIQEMEQKVNSLKHELQKKKSNSSKEQANQKLLDQLENRDQLLSKFKEKNTTLQQSLDTTVNNLKGKEVTIQSLQVKLHELQVQLETTQTLSSNDIVQRLQNELMEKEKEIRKLRNDQSRLNHEKVQLMDKVSELEVAQLEIPKLKKKLSGEGNKIKRLEEQNRELTTTHDKLTQAYSAVDKEREENKRVVEAQKRLHVHTEKLRVELEQTKFEREHLREERELSVRENQALKGEQSIFRQRIQKLELEMESLRGHLLLEQKSNDKLRTLQAKLGSKVEEEKDGQRKCQERVHCLEKEKMQLEGLIAQFKLDNLQLRAREDEHQRGKQAQTKDVSSVQLQLKSAQEKLSAVERESRTLQDELSALKSKVKIESASKIKAMEENSKALARVNELTVALQVVTASSRQNQQQVEKLQQELVMLKGKELAHNSNEQTAAQLQHKLKECEERNHVLSESNRVLLLRLKREEDVRKRNTG